MPFSFEKLDLPEVVRIKPRSFGDKRGFFAETYKRSEFCANGIPNMFVQDNYSYSERGVLRGLHYQKHPKPQGKLVMTLEGEIFDVAVDIRRGSPMGLAHLWKMGWDRSFSPRLLFGLYSRGVCPWFLRSQRQGQGRVQGHPGVFAGVRARNYLE